MVHVELSRYEAETGDLPEVCMRCGEPATVRKRYRFTWHPVWLYLLIPFGYLIYAIVAAILTQHVRCTTFLCDRHKNHWRVRTLWTWGPFLALVVVIVGSCTLAEALSSQLGKPAQDWVFGSLCVAVPVLLLCWFISIPIIQGTAIHPTDVTEEGLRLQGVSPLYVAAVEEYRKSRRVAVLVEDYDRKFQARRGERPAASEKHYSPKVGGGNPAPRISPEGVKGEQREHLGPSKDEGQA